ncbi:MAG TPA: hypothetical protein VK475_07085, partial [Pyrinomonadaceae bacterium]|nr:hypothetical protein [Pyrinomonadaceae bacterium]
MRSSITVDILITGVIAPPNEADPNDMPKAAEDRPYLLINFSNQLPGRLSLWLLVLSLMTLSISCRQPPSAKKDAASPTPTAIATPVQYPSPVIGKAYRGSGVVKIVNLKEGW